MRLAENVSASEALKAKLIDVVAADERALLRALDGFTITGTKARQLRTQSLRIEHFDAPIASGGDIEDSTTPRRCASWPRSRRSRS